MLIRSNAAILFVALTLLMLCSLASAGDMRAEDDITINATTTEDAACADCPGGKGTKICYEVTYAANATHDGRLCDFHIETRDANAGNFKCSTTTTTWAEAEHDSQQEGGTNKHYLSWWSGTSECQGDGMKKDETKTFCFVYCGSTNNLDNTIEFIATDDGRPLPKEPENGDRGNVPDSGGHDDPGWLGPIEKAPGSKVGFIMADVPATSEWGLIVMTLLVLTVGTVVLGRRRRLRAA